MSEHEDTDDDLGIDLDAWQAPPATDVADAVIARMRSTQVTAVAAPVEPARPSGRRWFVLGGGIAAATAVAGALLVAFVVTRPPASGQGAVVAEKPQHLALGPSSAELDRGTAVTWRREKHRITAQQQTGAATWRVDDDDTLTIDAMLASIEATDASLRVEVHMMSDAERAEREDRERTKKTVGTSALTAAAVALVTVIVYDGSVKVIEDGKTKTVPAGVAYQIRANGPNEIVEQMVVGGAPVRDDIDEQLMNPPTRERIEQLRRELEAKKAELENLKRTIEERESRQVDPFEKCDEVSCVLNNYEGHCCAKYRKYAEALDRAAIARGVTGIRSQVADCGGDYDGKITASVKVAPDGSVRDVAMDPASAAPSACIANVFRGARFDRTSNGGSFKYPFVFSVPPKRNCDADKLHAEGADAFASGNFSKALVNFDLEDRCRPSVKAKKFAFASACRAKVIYQAQRFWRVLTPTQRNDMGGFCFREGITYETLDANTGNGGTLRVIASTGAKILVDGVEHGSGTLVLDNLAPGKHKVTFIVGHDKHTFSVNVKSGETTTLDKSDLQ